MSVELDIHGHRLNVTSNAAQPLSPIVCLKLIISYLFTKASYSAPFQMHLETPNVNVVYRPGQPLYRPVV